MSRYSLPPISRSAATDPGALYTQLRVIVDQLQVQLNNQPQVSSRSDDKVEKGLLRNDLVIQFTEGVLKLGIFDGKKARFLNSSDLQSLQSRGTNFIGRKQGTTGIATAGTLALFPNQDDWGFYDRTAPVHFYLVYNTDGSTLKSIELT